MNLSIQQNIAYEYVDLNSKSYVDMDATSHQTMQVDLVVHLYQCDLNLVQLE